MMCHEGHVNLKGRETLYGTGQGGFLEEETWVVALLCGNRWSVPDHSGTAVLDRGVWGFAVGVTSGMDILTQIHKYFCLLSGAILERLSHVTLGHTLLLCLG